jgi:uncharacterized protein (DUF736 family)
MIGPLPQHRPLNEWETRVSAAWIAAILDEEANEYLRVIMSNESFQARELALWRRNECLRLIPRYQRVAQGSGTHG